MIIVIIVIIGVIIVVIIVIIGVNNTVVTGAPATGKVMAPSQRRSMHRIAIEDFMLRKCH